VVVRRHVLLLLLLRRRRLLGALRLQETSLLLAVLIT
jgi:hypothetical protein